MTGPSFPGAQDIADSILRGLGDVIRTSIDAWWDQSGPVVFGRMVGIMLGALVQWVWSTAGPLIGQVQFFTRIPPQWTVELAPLQQFHANARPIALLALGIILLVSLAVAGIGLVTGRPFSGLLGGVTRYLLCLGALTLLVPFMGWWVRFANVASDSMFGSGGGLPGFSQMEALDRLAATGIVGVVWLIFGLWFFVKRILLIGLVIALWIASPFALVAGALPWETGQRFFSWWLTSFVAATLVQILQSGLLAVGGYMISAPIVTGGAPSDAAQDLTTAAVGAGMIACAAWLPGFLLGGIVASGIGGSASGALKLAATLASFGGGAAVGSTVVHSVYGHCVGLGAGAGPAWNVPPSAPGGMTASSGAMGGGMPPPQYASVHQVTPSATYHVRSVLGGAPLALPAPAPSLPKPEEK